jgi:hypothetical protein
MKRSAESTDLIYYTLKNNPISGETIPLRTGIEANKCLFQVITASHILDKI